MSMVLHRGCGQGKSVRRNPVQSVVGLLALDALLKRGQFPLDALPTL